MTKKKKNSKLTEIVISIILFTILLVLSISLFKVSIIPSKYLIYILIALLLLTILVVYLMFKHQKKLFKVISICFGIILLIGVIIANFFSNKIDGILTNLTDNKYQTIVYSVLVRKDSSDNLNDYLNKEISITNDEYLENIKKEISKKLNGNLKIEDNFVSMLDNLLNSKVDLIVVKNNYLELLEESNSTSLSGTKVLFTLELNILSEDISKEVNVALEPFTVLISGIDTAGSINTVSRSDVNILVTINPKTYEIVLVHIPRDYFVTFNSTGTKDKLTHTGIYGIDETVKTIEDFMNIDINYYIKINFSTFLNLVDLIGNIEVNNPVAFYNWGVYFNEGTITLNSKEALIYSRSRKMLLNGDIDRGLNQERVLEAIIKKLSNPSTAKNATNILNTMSSSFITNLSESEIKELLNFELNYLPDWKITSTNVTGSDLYTLGTPFYPYYELYVMVPNEESIVSARALIKKVKGE